MGPGFESVLNEAMAELARQREGLTRLHHGMEETTGSAYSSRRQVSVTVDGRGEITELTFHGRAYRSLPPAELANMIVDTIRRARESARATMLESVHETLPKGADAGGRYDWTAALDDAITLPQSLVDLLGGLSISLPAAPEPRAPYPPTPYPPAPYPPAPHPPAPYPPAPRRAATAPDGTPTEPSEH